MVIHMLQVLYIEQIYFHSVYAIMYTGHFHILMYILMNCRIIPDYIQIVSYECFEVTRLKKTKEDRYVIHTLINIF